MCKVATHGTLIDTSRLRRHVTQDAFWRDAGEGQKSKASKKKDDDEAKKCACF